MPARAEAISIESDEQGFELHLWVDEDPRISEDGHFVLNIHSIDLDAFYDQVKARLGPYLREMHEARRTLPTRFECDPDESGGVAEGVVVAIREDGSYRVEPDEDAYDPTDPKHPDWHSVHADHYDNREKV